MSNEKLLEEELHISFYIVVYKFVLGVLELLLALGIFFFGKRILFLYENFKSQELLEDPHDAFVTITEKILPYLWERKGYVILILLILAIVKIVGSIGLFYRKHWGQDLLVGLTFIVLPFELFNLVTFPSIPKIIFFSFNVFIAFYLIEFQPKEYYSNFKKRVIKK